MHQKRSVLGYIPLLHRIPFSVAQCVLAVKSQVWCIKKPKTLQTRVLSVCPDDTSPEYRKKLYFYKETYRQRRAE